MTSAGRGSLELLTPRAPTPTVSFCSHCAARPDPAATASASRVCPSCGLGLLLQASEDAAPEVGAAFLVLDGSLAVCGMSRAAEKLLFAKETQAVHRPVTDLIAPADAEAQPRGSLAAAVAFAAQGDASTRRVVVRPADTFGVRLAARIVSCGPPRGALLIFD
jgi:hypothetical protein